MGGKRPSLGAAPLFDRTRKKAVKAFPCANHCSNRKINTGNEAGSPPDFGPGDSCALPEREKGREKTLKNDMNEVKNYQKIDPKEMQREELEELGNKGKAAAPQKNTAAKKQPAKRTDRKSVV